MTIPPKGLFWCDLETTGLDPFRDHILEVAVIITDLQLNELTRWHEVLKLTPKAAARLASEPFVLDMHEKSGLLKESQDSTLTLGAAYAGLQNFMIDAGYHQGELMLAGSGVLHFDINFLKHHMPEVASSLSYYAMDIGVLRRGIQVLSGRKIPSVPESFVDGFKKHRAMDDVTAHLLESSLLADYLSEYLPPVS